MERVAHGSLYTEGAYKNGKPDPRAQAGVVAVLDQTLVEEVLEPYIQLQSLRSLPYRALRVENLLFHRVLYHGFDKIVDRYPLEPFIATKDRQWELDFKAKELTRDLFEDFAYFRMKENQMNVEEINVPTLIDEIVQHYIKWRVYNKGQDTPDKKQTDAVFKKKSEQRDLKKHEQQKLSEVEVGLLDKYNAARAKAIEREFIDFRGTQTELVLPSYLFRGYLKQDSIQPPNNESCCNRFMKEISGKAVDGLFLWPFPPPGTPTKKHAGHA